MILQPHCLMTTKPLLRHLAPDHNPHPGHTAGMPAHLQLSITMVVNCPSLPLPRLLDDRNVRPGATAAPFRLSVLNPDACGEVPSHTRTRAVLSPGQVSESQAERAWAARARQERQVHMAHSRGCRGRWARMWERMPDGSSSKVVPDSETFVQWSCCIVAGTPATCCCDWSCCCLRMICLCCALAGWVLIGSG
jgi:hypothetical protein